MLRPWGEPLLGLGLVGQWLRVAARRSAAIGREPNYVQPALAAGIDPKRKSPDLES
jgi:hypothetical protein